MNLLITGAEGYLGGRLIQYFSSFADKIYTAGRRSAFNNSDTSSVEHRHFDLTSASSMAGVCKDVDVVIHLAALNEVVCQQQPALAIQANIGGTYHLLQEAFHSGVKHFIYLSTAHIYGAPLVGSIDESTLPKPVHPYAISKKGAEDFVLAMQGKMNITVFRLSNSFGYPVSENINRWKLIGNDLCRQLIETGHITLHSSGQQQRDFVTISDVARAIHFAMDNTVLDLYNLGGKALSIYAFAELVASRYKHSYGKEATIFTKKDASPQQNFESLSYSTALFSASGFDFENNFEAEIDHTLSFCEKAFLNT